MAETIIISRAIVYGSIATPIKKPENEHTHKWTVYVRGFNNEDISYYIRRVTFKLHESFAEPNRNVDQPPFEVTETGWGEFQIQIRITFQDAAEKPILLTHHLKLYPPEDLGQLKTSRSVVSEHYDEIIFDPPSESMARLLSQNAHLSQVEQSERYQELKEMEAVELAKIKEAITRVQEQKRLLLDEQATAARSTAITPPPNTTPQHHQVQKQRSRSTKK